MQPSGFDDVQKKGGEGDLVTEQRIHLRVCTFLLSTLICSVGSSKLYEIVVDFRHGLTEIL